MKTVKMKLGTGYVDVSVPEENLLGLIAKEVSPSKMTEDEVVLDALPTRSVRRCCESS